MAARLHRRLRKERERNTHFSSLSFDPPLFSFRLNRRKVLLQAVIIAFVMFISYKAISEWTHNFNFYIFFMAQFVTGVVLVASILYFLDIIFTRKIVLYNSKIVKTWILGPSREVWFVHAKYNSFEIPYCNAKIFYPCAISNFFTPILGVFYDDSLVSRKDSQRMNHLLAEISGRDIGLFESRGLFGCRNVSLRYFLQKNAADACLESETERHP